jgi:hypothetical protein
MVQWTVLKMTTAEFQSLRQAVASLSAEDDSTSYARSLVALAKRAQLLLNPPASPTVETRDAIQHFRRFASDQRAIDWAHQQKITLAKGICWWWIGRDDRQAHINGLEADDGATLVGFPRITNGIDVWMERADGTIFLGHRDSLVWHKLPRQSKDQSAEHCAVDVKTEYIKLAKKLLAQKETDGLARFRRNYALLMQKPLTFSSVTNLGMHIQLYMDKFIAQGQATL